MTSHIHREILTLSFEQKNLELSQSLCSNQLNHGKKTFDKPKNWSPAFGWYRPAIRLALHVQKSLVYGKQKQNKNNIVRYTHYTHTHTHTHIQIRTHTHNTRTYFHKQKGLYWLQRYISFSNKSKFCFVLWKDAIFQILVTIIWLLLLNKMWFSSKI